PVAAIVGGDAAEVVHLALAARQADVEIVLHRVGIETLGAVGDELRRRAHLEIGLADRLLQIVAVGLAGGHVEGLVEEIARLGEGHAGVADAGALIGADVAALPAHTLDAGAHHLALAAAAHRAAAEAAAGDGRVAVERERHAELGDAVARPAGLRTQRDPAAEIAATVGRLGAGAR